MPQDKYDLGIIGLATMGRSLALNFLDHGHRISVWNLEPELTRAFAGVEPRDGLHAADSLADLINSLAPPRRVLLMIKAGAPVDDVIESIQEHLDDGDMVIDGGNAHFEDTRRRESALRARGIDFVGLGVSGGETGARYGPSLMVGASSRAWTNLEAVLRSIAAHGASGPCVDHMGTDGAGHFVKMVHNGIEYADMQLIAETYDLLRRGSGLPATAIAELFELWNGGPLQSYLIELTAQVLTKLDDVSGEPLVESILDAAEQKGTGRWTVQTALELGTAVPTIAAAVDARALSSRKAEREAASGLLSGPRLDAEQTLADDGFHNAFHNAVLAAKICAYAQGMSLIRAGSETFGWQIDLARPARVWTGGCIIRARLLDDIIAAYENNPDLQNLVLDPALVETLEQTVPALRQIAAWASGAGIPIPAFAASLAWFDSVRSARLPQNLTQAQRDAFGAHTYIRLDDPSGTPVHTQWLSN